MKVEVLFFNWHVLQIFLNNPFSDIFVKKFGNIYPYTHECATWLLKNTKLFSILIRKLHQAQN